MTTIASQRSDILIRGHILEPGEALPWHTDLCHRVVVTIRGDRLRTEYQDSTETETVVVQPGATHWNEPQPRVHRVVNIGNVRYEKVSSLREKAGVGKVFFSKNQLCNGKIFAGKIKPLLE